MMVAVMITKTYLSHGTQKERLVCETTQKLQRSSGLLPLTAVESANAAV